MLPTVSKVDGGMAVEDEPSHQYSITFCCCATDGSRGAVWQNIIWHRSIYGTQEWIWIPPCRKKWHPLTFINACWMSVESKQWIGAQWGGEWRVSAVAIAMWKTSHGPDGHTQLSCHGMKSILTSSPDQGIVYRAEYWLQSMQWQQSWNIQKFAPGESQEYS